MDGRGGRLAVVAMLLLAGDGTDPDLDALARMWEETGGQIDRINYRTILGQPVVLEGCTVEGGAWFS